jgi:predicted nucleic acid-binding protein
MPSRRDPYADLYRPHVEGRTGAISPITIGELYVLATRNKWGTAKVLEMEAHLRRSVVLRFDFDVCRVCARLKTGLKNPQGSNRVLDNNDLWIAACAVRYGIPLVTHNRRHFEGISGLNLITEAPN